MIYVYTFTYAHVYTYHPPVNSRGNLGAEVFTQKRHQTITKNIKNGSACIALTSKNLKLGQNQNPTQPRVKPKKLSKNIKHHYMQVILLEISPWFL